MSVCVVLLTYYCTSKSEKMQSVFPSFRTFRVVQISVSDNLPLFLAVLWYH